MRRHIVPNLIIAALFGVVVSSLLAGCQRATTTSGPILKSATLQRYPEYTLRYPGATLIGEGGQDAENGPFFYSRAFAGATLGADASIQEVFEYYNRELVARGWQLSNLDTVPTTAEIDSYAWRKGHVIFRLGFQRQNDPRNPTSGNQYATTISISLIADDPRDPGWTSQP